MTQPKTDPARPERDENARPYIFAGLFTVVVLIGGLIAWLTTAKIDGAVIAPGTVVVESNRKAVQHLEGGVIGEILVREGDRVDAGQVLVRLDKTIEQSNLAVIVDQMHELKARRRNNRPKQEAWTTMSQATNARASDQSQPSSRARAY